MLASWIISRTVLNTSETAGHEVSFRDCPRNSRTVGNYVICHLAPSSAEGYPHVGGNPETGNQIHTKQLLLDYRSHLISLQLLPLMMLYELNDIIFFVKSLNSITSSFNIWTMFPSVNKTPDLQPTINWSSLPPALIKLNISTSTDFPAMELPTNYQSQSTFG